MKKKNDVGRDYLIILSGLLATCAISGCLALAFFGFCG